MEMIRTRGQLLHSKNPRTPTGPRPAPRAPVRWSSHTGRHGFSDRRILAAASSVALAEVLSSAPSVATRFPLFTKMSSQYAASKWSAITTGGRAEAGPMPGHSLASSKAAGRIAMRFD